MVVMCADEIEFAECVIAEAMFVQQPRVQQKERTESNVGKACRNGQRRVRTPTLVFERTPLLPSIQMYSAITEPFWSSFMNLRSCAKTQQSRTAVMAERQATYVLRIGDDS
jgi:hypothetical protein